jgi:hypothetical protein
MIDSTRKSSMAMFESLVVCFLFVEHQDKENSFIIQIVDEFFRDLSS